MGQDVSRQECEQVKHNYRLESDELDAWVRVFKRYAGRGQMDLRGFLRAFSGTGERQENLEQLFRVFDWDGSGEISFNEFMFAVLVNSRVPTRIKIKYAFEMIDKDNSGFVELPELMDLVYNVSATKSMLLFDDEAGFDRRVVEETFRRMDTDGDGCISFCEFVQNVERHGAWILRLFDIRQ
ncbi:hypothetical protein BOX15_Mlig025370g2 [Macrostomum lignano]|uniref:EF-hand domain-containing protein n=1 Tax=Macrostomum lignano TaxID=282301 RepID=A0A267EMN6_9PLAT|nr:hypothetical protein BOX15_Mlig025370g2 [Macrostomum lignano]